MNKKVLALLIICTFSIILMCLRLKYIRADIYNKKACRTQYISDGLKYLDKAIEIDNNPLFWFNKGIILSRTDSLFMSSFLDDDLDSINLDSIIKFFDNAVKLSENEWAFKLNYSLAIWLNCHDKENSKEILREAIVKHDVGCELIGILGLMEEKSNNVDEALKLYSRLLIQRPSVVDSPFFYDLRQRNAAIAETVLDSAIHYCSDRLMENPITMAKLGILLIGKKEKKEAQELLSNAVREMPTLNRAWYYLGVLAEQNNQIQTSHDMFMKSMKLDRGDLLVSQKVSSFDSNYVVENDIIKSIKKNELAIALSDRYLSATVKEPYLLIGLTDYFSPKIR